jgi:hypothetical protein
LAFLNANKDEMIAANDSIRAQYGCDVGTAAGGGGYTYGDEDPNYVLTTADGAGNYIPPDAADVRFGADVGVTYGTLTGIVDAAGVLHGPGILTSGGDYYNTGIFNGTDYAADGVLSVGTISTLDYATEAAGGTYHEADVSEVQDGVMFGANSTLEGEYVGGGGGYTYGDDDAAFVLTTADGAGTYVPIADSDTVDGGVSYGSGEVGTGVNATTLLSTLGLSTGNLDTQLAARTGYKLAADGLDSITVDEPTGKPTTFRGWLMWLVQGKRRSTKSATAIVVKTEAGATVTTQAITSSGDDETLGAPS